MHATQLLHHWLISPALCFTFYFDIGSQETSQAALTQSVAPKDLELVILLY